MNEKSGSSIKKLSAREAFINCMLKKFKKLGIEISFDKISKNKQKSGTSIHTWNYHNTQDIIVIYKGKKL